ncbi:6935_t:CDS:2 [Scutellospora calospora]|uniref:6935_t:CDS:1 n=1 Tax=Scutellospora calospora TaxID=85575 RepID=A0ACA9KCJ2_9GLOM|nr:6935_t:CDS:2 [Scutellospora calospora]
MEDLNSENPIVEKENTEASSVRTPNNSNKENITTESIQVETAMEIEDSNSPRILIVPITTTISYTCKLKILKKDSPQKTCNGVQHSQI